MRWAREHPDEMGGIAALPLSQQVGALRDAQPSVRVNSARATQQQLDTLRSLLAGKGLRGVVLTPGGDMLFERAGCAPVWIEPDGTVFEALDVAEGRGCKTAAQRKRRAGRR